METKTPAPPVRTVLVANDHEWSARSIETILTSEGYEVIRAFTAEQTMTRVLAKSPDAVVLDVQLPDRDGMSLCEAIRTQTTLGRVLPVILTTAGPSGRKERMAAYRAGAWEFFGQPLDGEVLLAKLRTFLEARAVAEAADHLVDSRTGLYTRSGLLRRGREMAADAKRRHVSVGCVVLRPRVAELAAALEATERLADEVASLLQRAGRAADAFGRIGPLEFGVVVGSGGPSELRALVDRLNAVARDCLKESDGRPIEFQAAIATRSDPAPSDVEAMLEESIRGVAAHPFASSSVPS